ncbi:class I SAM-dependent methyltransferase [Bradyrhizobium diazoefficiens]
MLNSTRTETVEYWPDEQTVRSIDAILRDEWLLDLHPDIARISAKYPETEDVVSRYDEVHERAVRKAGPNGKVDEREMFRLLAHPGLFAFAAAARRHIVLDGIAFAIGVLRHFAFNGAVLDAGCHIGVSTSILGRLATNKIVGLDPVGPAIDRAKKLSVGLPNVEFIRGMLPWKSPMQFDLVFCQDVLHHIPQTSHPNIIASLGGLLNEGGVLLLSADDVIDPAWINLTAAALRDARLGYARADVLGGFGGNPPEFKASTAVLLRKGDTAPIPSDLASISAREWDLHFKDFANTTDRPAREKTQAFERSSRRTRRQVEKA